MARGDNNERIRRAAERSTPPLPPEVRKRALWAAMAAMRRRSPVRTAVLGVVVLLVMLLVVAAGVYGLLRWLAG